jgi:dihydroorotate dehydrogenase electron transfer subunit
MPAGSVTALVVTGGIGIASVHFLLAHLLKKPSAPAILLYGVRSADEIIPLEGLERKGLLIRMATEDGKRGLKGTVVDLLSNTLGGAGAPEKKSTEAFVCGPPGMLRAAAGTLAAFGIKGHFSLESRMACGYGVCQGCVVPVRDEAAPDGIRYRKVCTDGPVFPAERICWEDIR